VTSAQLLVEEKRTQGTAVLVLSGAIDMATAGALRDAADRSLRTMPSRLVLDFAAVTFCDSQGLSALISLNRRVSATSGRLVLVNIGEFMRRLLDITGLHAAFDLDLPADPGPANPDH
jgi:anti-sigma B factor antagonist